MGIMYHIPPPNVKGPSWARNIRMLRSIGYNLKFRPFSIDGIPTDPYLLDLHPIHLVALIRDKIGVPGSRQEV